MLEIFKKALVKSKSALNQNYKKSNNWRKIIELTMAPN